jgi:arylsulfatase A
MKISSLLFMLCFCAAAERPNVVIFLADDLGWGDVRFNNPESYIDTPNMDRLAKEGMVFKHGYSSSAMCSPARAGLLTGRTPTKLGIHNWIKDRHKKPVSDVHLKTKEQTIATVLKAAGYQTAAVGKWHLNNDFRTGNNSDPDHHGFDYWFCTAIHSYPSHKDPNTFWENGKACGVIKGYAAGIVADKSITWLKNRDKAKPFFLYVPFEEAHVVCDAPQNLKDKYLGKIKEGKIPLKKGFGKDGIGQAEYYGCVENMDFHMGRILDYLDKEGLSDNTLIVFSSDNGPDTGRVYEGRNQAAGSAGDFQGRKRWLLEGGIRVPTVIRFPVMIKKAAVSEEPVGHLDLMPTLVNLCKALLPKKELDGTDISEILNGNKITRQKLLNWHLYCSVKGPNSVLRSGEWVLTAEWSGKKTGGRFHPQIHTQYIKESSLKGFKLYDVTADPGQKENLTDKYPEVSVELKKKLVELHRRAVNEAPEW